MTVDYRRMVWQVRANRIAFRVRLIAFLVMMPEVAALLILWFPIWDDIAFPVTLAIHLIAAFVQYYTEPYRAALDVSALEPLE